MSESTQETRADTDAELRSMAQFPEENPDPLLRATGDGAVLYANRPARAMLAEMGWREGLVLPEAFLAPVGRVVSSGQYQEIELTCPRGRVWSFALVPVAGQRYVNLYAHDVTERKRAEATLQKAHDQLEVRVHGRTAELRQAMDLVQAQRQRFRDALDQLPAYLVLLSPDYHVPFANRFFEERFGTSNGRRCFEYLFNRTEPCEICETYNVLKTNAPHRWEWTGPDGRNYDIYDFPFTDTDGSPLIMEVGLDITERKRAEAALKQINETLKRRVAERTAALRESEADLNRAQAVAQTGSWRLDVWQNELVWSDENHRLFGIPKGTPLTYEAFLAAVHPDDREHVDRHWQAALRGEPYDVEHRIVVGERVRWVRERAELEFDNDGSLRGGFGTAQDITERKRAEEELRRTSEDLARSNKDLEQFAYVASHDLQEPLRVVTGFVQLLKQQYGDRLDADADKYIEFATDGAKWMKLLINDLLAYSRVGTRGGEPAPTDASEVLRRALANLQTGIEETAAEITHSPLPTVRADGAQLVHLFQNLIGNALKFRSQSPSKIHVDACQEGDHWLFSVRDNGIGIDPEFREQIFLIFQRLHTRQQYPGTGIGLAICKKIVDRHGGQIWVESQPGLGSTFYFTLPA